MSELTFVYLKKKNPSSSKSTYDNCIFCLEYECLLKILQYHFEFCLNNVNLCVRLVQYGIRVHRAVKHLRPTTKTKIKVLK